MSVPVSKALVKKLLEEEAVGFNEARYFFPERPDLSTLHRWRTRGVKGIRLEAICSGGKWFTSRDAALRFMQRTTAAG